MYRKFYISLAFHNGLVYKDKVWESFTKTHKQIFVEIIYIYQMKSNKKFYIFLIFLHELLDKNW